MAAPFDVAGRLAEGIPAVQDAQTYVWACHLRGYQNPDLTSHGAQVGEWYGTEDGLDLGALDADCAALGAAAKSLDDALRLARAQVAELPQAWMGPGAAAAADFLRRHCDSAAMLVDEVAKAAQSAAILRDELWRVVDHKVEFTAAIEDRTHGQRGIWLAAARAVLAGDPAARDSAQVLDGQVKPFVDDELASQWVPEMRATVAAAAEAYRVALAALVAGPGVRFDIPGDLGPTYDGPVSRAFAPAPVPTPMPVAPMGAAPSPSMTPPSMTPPAMAAPSMPPTTMDPLVSPPPAPPTSASAPAAMPLADGSAPLAPAGAIPARLADALGGLLSPSAGSPPDSLADLADPAEIAIPDAEEDPAEVDPAEEDAVDEDAVDEDAADEDPAEVDPAEEDPAEEDEAEVAPAEDPAAAEGVPAEAGEPDGACPKDSAPPPAPEPVSDGATPCEIAADELPQAGQ